MREKPVSKRRAARGALGHGMPCLDILEAYVEHGEQAKRRNGGPIACFDRQGEKRGLAVRGEGPSP